jgi:hypothetical protein
LHAAPCSIVSQYRASFVPQRLELQGLKGSAPVSLGQVRRVL